MGYVASAERVVLWDMWPWLRELYFVVYGASAERVVLLLYLLPSYCRVTIITCDSVYSCKQQNSQSGFPFPEKLLYQCPTQFNSHSGQVVTCNVENSKICC